MDDALIVQTQSVTPSSCLPGVFFFANGIYGHHVAGGDIHFVEVARSAAEAGYNVSAFGSKILEDRLKAVDFPCQIFRTSNRVFGKSAEQSITGQLSLLWDYVLRTCRNLKYLKNIQNTDVAYAIADSWCDTIPVALSRAGSKMLVLHMEAPKLTEILCRSRPDVDRFRVAALHYWASQKLSLLLLRLAHRKHIFYVHPAMRESLLKAGFAKSEISPMSFGLDTAVVESVPDQPKTYDLAWIGRVHRQKGISDLLTVLSRLAQRIPLFRAVLIGRGAEELKHDVKRLGLEKCVEFPGLVTEHEKIRILKSSRMFLMPSRHEGSPRTIGEALLCRVPVVAYAVPTYKPIFGTLLQYVPCFDVHVLEEQAAVQIFRMRAGANYLSESDVMQFEQLHSWTSVHTTFQAVLKKAAIENGPRATQVRDTCG